MFIKQDPMRRVVYSLVPIFLWSVFLYGWRSVVLTAVVFILGILTEFVAEKARNKKVSEAVLVTCALFSLSLPPAVPLWIAAIGIVFAVLIGKEVYGGFGRNIFNPAITGRIFTYVSFPLLMQTTWMLPGNFGLTGMNKQALGSTWTEAVFVLIVVALAYLVITKNAGNKKILIGTSIVSVVVVAALYVVSAYTGWRGTGNYEIDIITTATPLELFRADIASAYPNEVPTGYEYLLNTDLLSLFFGFRVGALGEGAIFLVVIAGVYLMWTKTANWRMILSTFLSALVLTCIFYWSGAFAGGKLAMLNPMGKAFGDQVADILKFMMSGSLLYVAVFMSTDPVSAPKKPLSQFIYGTIIGGVTIVIRAFSGFPEGTSFAILTANTFAALIDELVPAAKKTTKPATAKPAAPEASTKEGAKV